MIVARDLARAFGSVVAVSNVTFTAGDGCITGLLGPNGAGKSTTLRMLYTVLRPDAGSAQIDGIDVVQQPLQARGALGVLPHAAGIYPHLTARENVRYFGRLHGLTGTTLERRIEVLLGLLDMQEVADRRAKGFSQGQRIKVAIARALVHAPRNLILDEPTNGLDVMAIRNLRELLRRLRDAGHCVLLSSHVMQEVAELCDSVVIIARGSVLAHGTPDELRRAAGTESLEEAFLSVIAPASGSAS